MGILFSVLLIIAAHEYLFNAEERWKLGHFLTVKGGEPTKFYFIMCKITGVICGVIGVIVGVYTLYSYWQML